MVPGRHPIDEPATPRPSPGPLPPRANLRPMPTSSSTDEELVEQAQGGDRDAFEILVRRHADRLYAVVVRFTGGTEEAEDVTQETFLRAWRSIGRFQGRSLFFTWLYRIGINEAKRRAERAASRIQTASMEEDEGIDVADEREGPYRRTEQAELRAALEAAVRSLSPDYRAPLVLRDIEGLSTQEAAAVMDLGEAAFKARLHRARLAVRKAIDVHLDEEAGA